MLVRWRRLRIDVEVDVVKEGKARGGWLAAEVERLVAVRPVTLSLFVNSLLWGWFLQ